MFSQQRPKINITFIKKIYNITIHINNIKLNFVAYLNQCVKRITIIFYTSAKIL